MSNSYTLIVMKYRKYVKKKKDRETKIDKGKRSWRIRDRKNIK